MRTTGKARPEHQAIQIARDPHPWPKLLELSGQVAGGLYVGAWPDDGAFAQGAPLVFAQPRRCLLVCAPSQAGKTTALAIPQLLAAPGPAVATSTKLDVFHATALVRSILGQIWVYDVAGTEDIPPGATRLRWSPVVGAKTWEGALGTARVMTKIANPSAGLQQSTFWTERSSTVLAVLLHRAALEDAPMAAVMDYAQAKDAAEVGQALERAGASDRALGAAHDIAQIAANEASGTWNTALVTLGAYQSQHALDACDLPNFDPDTFLDSLGTVYVTSGTDDQELYAPLIVGLVESIRKAAYRKARHAALDPPLYFILDEIANIAPLPGLVSLASEGAGRGIYTAAYFQSLRQAKARWGDIAADFMSLFTERILMPGVNDRETTDLFSLLVGDYDRTVHSQTLADTGTWGAKTESVTASTQRQPILPPSQVAAGPGRGSYWWHNAEVASWEARVAPLLATPWYASAPWPQVITSAMGAYQGDGLPCPQLTTAAFADTPERYQTYLDAAATIGTDQHPPPEQPPGPRQLPAPPARD